MPTRNLIADDKRPILYLVGGVKVESLESIKAEKIESIDVIPSGSHRGRKFDPEGQYESIVIVTLKKPKMYPNPGSPRPHYVSKDVSKENARPLNAPIVVDCRNNKLFKHPSELFGRISYSVLDNSEKAQFSRADKVAFEDGQFYIADFKSKKVLSFTKDGRFLFSIDGHSLGRQNPVSLTSFSVNRGMVFVLDGDSRTVLSYNSKTGEFIGRYSIDFEAWDIEALDNGDFLFAFAPLSLISNRDEDECYRFIRTDSKMKPVSKMVPFDPHSFDILSYTHYLSASGDKIVSAAFDIDGCHIFSRKDGTREKTYRLDLEHSIPADKRNDINALLSNTISYVALPPLMGGHVVQFMVRGEDGISPILYDTRNSRLFKNNMNDFSCFVYDVVCGMQTGLVALWRNNNSNYDYLSRNGFPRAAPEMESAARAGKPMLVFYEY